MTVATSGKSKSYARSTMVTAGLAGAAVIYVVAVFLPMQRSIQHLRNEVRDKQEHILLANRLQIPMQHSQERLRAVEAFTQRQDDRLPDTKAELLRTFGKINEQAKLAGVVVRRFDPGDSVEMASLRQAHLEMSLEGTFPQVMDFLSRLEELPYVIWIPNVTLGKVENSDGMLITEVTLTIFGNLADQSDFNDA